MNKILLDTNGYGAFKRNDPMATGVIRSVEYIWLSDEHFINTDGLILKSKAL